MYNAFSVVKRGRYVGEFLGTMFLVTIIKLAAASTNDNSSEAGFAIGFGLMLLIYQFGYISGAHFNPSVTTGLLIRGDLPTFPTYDIAQIALYYCVQIVGGILGGFIGQGIGGHGSCDVMPAVGTGYTVWQVFFAELIFTFLLVSVVLHVATHQGGNQFYGLSIGLTVFVGVICIGDISGNVLNPAVYFGLMVSSSICGEGSLAHWENIWAYIIPQILAPIVAGLLFKYIYIPANTANKKEYFEIMDVNQVRVSIVAENDDDDIDAGNASSHR